ncbi:MAG: PilN domain-containing protein [Magnetococcales bacterium]|nr:PilN domain-containing protein [Magnetococcales bacterium]
MIVTINLLPYRQARRLKKAHLILASWVGTTVAMLGILLLVHLRVTGILNEKMAQEQNNERTIANLDKQLGEVKDIRDLKSLIETKLKIISELKQLRNLPVRLIDTIIHSLPDKAWLKEVQTQGQTVKINGMAQSNAVVAVFMNNLNASPLINNVKLGQVALNSGTAAIKAFSLEAGFGPKKEAETNSKAGFTPSRGGVQKPADNQKKGAR